MTLPRSRRRELLDDDGHDPAELAHSLGQVATVNAWLGGTRSLTRHLEDLASTGSDTVRVLDVGTGNGRTLRGVVAWGRRRGGSWSGVGVDRSPETAVIAAAEGTRVVRADGLALPFADGAFDAVLCTLTLHHFPDAEARALVREMARVSRGRVLVSDLERSRLHYAGARVLAATLWRGNRLTRTDGPRSVLRSFTPGELLEIGRDAGLRTPVVERFFPWRLLLAGDAP